MITIAHLSDLHFGTERAALATALLAELQACPPTLVVVSGDLTQRARSGQFRAAREFLDGLPHPQLVVPGNHDVPLYDVARRFLSPLGRYRRQISDVLDPVFDDGVIFVKGLNTARSLTWQSGRISDQQIAALQVGLAATRATLRIVVTHHPFIPPPLPESRRARIDLVGRADLAMKVLDAGRVDVLLAGHLHHGYSGDTRTQYPAAHRGIICVQAGTAISRRVRGIEPNGYNWLTLREDDLSVEVRTWQADRFLPLPVVRYRRNETGWTQVTALSQGSGRSPGEFYGRARTDFR